MKNDNIFYSRALQVVHKLEKKRASEALLMLSPSGHS